MAAERSVTIIALPQRTSAISSKNYYARNILRFFLDFEKWRDLYKLYFRYIQNICWVIDDLSQKYQNNAGFLNESKW